MRIGVATEIEARAPYLIRRGQRRELCEGVVSVDVASHYCVANMPSAVPRTSTVALTNATPPLIQEVASRVPTRLPDSRVLSGGLQIYRGEVVHRAVAASIKQHEPRCGTPA